MHYDEIFGKVLKKEGKDSQMASIEYFLINLPETLTRNPKRFIKALCETNRDEMFDELAVQTILKFKWEAFTRKFFSMQAFIFFIFLCVFAVDLSSRKHAHSHVNTLTVSLKGIGVLC